MRDYRIFPLGDGAVTIEFGQEITADLNESALRLSAQLEHHRFEGFIEVMPAYASATVFYDPVAVRTRYSSHATAFSAVTDLLGKLISGDPVQPDSEHRIIDIPVDFSHEAGLDLDFVAENAKLSTTRFIQIFTASEYRVYMLGFIPGFAYMGEVDERIAAPRKKTPRMSVPKGSVGIAGRQTGIYPLESPGGWQIIGRTSLAMFDPDSVEPCALKPGDTVRFFDIRE